MTQERIDPEWHNMREGDKVILRQRVHDGAMERNLTVASRWDDGDLVRMNNGSYYDVVQWKVMDILREIREPVNEFTFVSAGDVVRLKYIADKDAAVQRWVEFKVAAVEGRETQMRLVAGDGEEFWSADWAIDNWTLGE